MFDMGFLELFLVAVTALVVLGPERLPQAAKTLGTWVAKSRGFASCIRDELEREANLAEIREQLKEEKEKFQHHIESLEGEKQQLRHQIEDAISLSGDDGSLGKSEGGGEQSSADLDKHALSKGHDHE